MAKQLIGTMVISIHSARVGGDLALESNIAVMDISIHSARVGGDGFDAFVDGSAMLFQSTPPVWAETCVRAIIMCSTVISIHSARVGGDPSCGQKYVGGSISIHSARVGGDSRGLSLTSQ